MDQEELFRGGGNALASLVRSIVRDELRKRLRPEGDHLMDAGQTPMSARRLRLWGGRQRGNLARMARTGASISTATAANPAR